jgi:hypothetical protein
MRTFNHLVLLLVSILESGIPVTSVSKTLMYMVRIEIISKEEYTFVHEKLLELRGYEFMNESVTDPNTLNLLISQLRQLSLMQDRIALTN